MFTASPIAQRASKWRAFAVVFSLVATLLVAATSLAPRAALADSGEAPYGTPTQALQAAMSLGSRHTCVISNGNLLCWGDNTLGQLGNGSSGTSSNTRPTYVVDSQASPTTPLAGVIGVIAATDHSCALINTGKVKCWGYGWKIGKYVSSGAASPYPTFVKDSWINTQAQSDASGDLTGVVGLAASTYNSCALINDGKVKCWGDDTGGGKLYRGTGYVLHCANDTFSVSCGSGSTSNVPISNIKSIVMSAQSACAIKNDANGTQLCWGNTDVFGYTFQGENSKMYASSAHSSVNGSKAFSLGQRTGCGLFEKVAGQAISVSGGQVKCWGMNGSKTLGRGDTLPDNIADRYNADVVPGLDNAIAISGEMDTFCALLIDRTAKCWGNNQPAKTGTGQAGFANGTPLPMRVGSITSDVLTDIYAVSVGADHVCIITGVSGNVKCSGTNTAGQLGDGSVTAKAVMTDVKAVSGDGSLEGAGADKMPPTLASVPPVAVNTAGTKVILSYSELLASSGSIPVGQFVVKVGGVSKTISSATVNGQTVELNMAERIAPGAVVRMGYNDPTSGDDTNIIEDASFNDAATISERDITNNSTTEGVAPTLVSAAVDSTGEFLTLTYSEALGTTTALTTAFAVTYGGSSKTPTARSVSGSTVVLTLSPRVQRTDSVTVDYAAPTADLETTNTAIQDAAGNDAASFSATAATNSSTYDTIVPTFVSGAMNGLKTKMILTFSEALSATVPTAGQFRYRVNGGSDITPTTAVTISGSTVEVTLNTAIVDGNTIEFTYTDSSGSNDVAAIQDTAGNDAATISTFTTVANVADTTAPVQQSAAVDSAGTSLTLTYDEELNSTTAAKEAFTVTVGGVSRTVSAASVSGSTVVLTLSPAVQRNEVVAVTYAAPTPSSSGTSNNAVQDSLGNDAASFSSSALVVTNSSTIDTTAPTFVSATVSTGGNILLTYSEALNTTTAPTSRFQVTIAGTAVTVSSVTVSGSVVTIVTTPVVGAGQSVAVTYSAPSSGNTIEDSAGNDAASSGAAWTISGGNNLSTLDLTGPTLVSSAVNTSGAAVLTFSETLGATGPSASAFTVTVDGVTLTVTSVTIVGATVVIVTSPKIEAGKAATIVYNAPSLSSATSNSAIQDATGNDAAGATFTVSSANNASTYDPTPPTQTGSEVNDAGKLVITYSETLATPGPDASQFTVTIDGKTATIVSVEIVDNKIVITTSPLIAGGEAVTWGYADATTGNDPKGIQDAAGNDVGSGTSGSGSVTNGSKVSNVDPVPPTVTGSQVDDGGKVVISFSETIATPGPDSSQFIVTIDGSPVTIVSVVVVDNKVVITTAPLVAEGQTVTWKYADTTTGNDQKAIQDKSGNDLSSTSGSGSVSNGSKVTKEAAELEEDPSTTMLSDEVTVDGVSGTATFGDGSQIVVSGKNLKIRFKTGYIGNAGGTVTGTYLVGKKKTTYKCTVASFGTEKKNPSAKRIYPSKKMGLWFKKKVYSPKKPCVMPTAMQTALKTQRITLTVKLNFKRLWPNTAKAVDDKGNKIPKSTRIMKLKIGKKPTV
jgi:uncharacterized repeat protein (TIGR02059 family)